MFNFATALGGRVSKEEAQKHFDKYYENKTPGYSAMAKKRDAEVSKTGKWLLIPGTPESVKYLHKNGVKYYDMVGVDAFEQGTFKMRDNQNKLQTYPTKKVAKTKKGESYSNYNKRTYKENHPNVHLVNHRWIKEYQKRISKLEVKLDSLKSSSAKHEVKEQIRILKGKIENLTETKKQIKEQKKTEVVESKFESSDSDSDEEFEVLDDIDDKTGL